MHVSKELNPYSSHFVKTENHWSAEPDPAHRCAMASAPISSQKIAGGSKPVEASRVKWENAPSFDAADFLDPLTQAHHRGHCRRGSKAGSKEAAETTKGGQKREGVSRGDELAWTSLHGSRTVFPMEQGGASQQQNTTHTSNSVSFNPSLDNFPIESGNGKLPDIRSPDIKHRPIKLAAQFCSQFWQCRTAVTLFARASLAGKDACNVDGDSRSSLWPVPLPRHWRWTAYEHPGPRRRMRRRFLRVRHQMVQIILCCLNFEACGFNPAPPPRAQLGAPISEAQHQISIPQPRNSETFIPYVAQE